MRSLIATSAILAAACCMGSSLPGAAAPMPRPGVDNKLTFPLDVPLPAKPKEEGGAGLDEAEIIDGTSDLRAALNQISRDMGQGYNTFLREKTGNCVDGTIYGPVVTSFKTTYSLSLIESDVQLKEEMTAEASASGGFAGWTAKVSAKLATEQSSNSNTKFLLLKVKSVATPNITLQGKAGTSAQG